MKKIFLPLFGAALTLNAVAETQESWALIEGPDGKTWSISTVSEMINLGNEYYDDFRYNTVNVTLFDASHQVKGTFTIDVTGQNANSLEVFGPVTNHLFNADDQYELGVQIHIPGNSANGYVSQMLFQAYSMDGSKLVDVEGSGIIAADAQCPSLIVSHDVADDTYFGKNVIDIYQPAANGLELKKSIELGYDLLDYMSGSAIITANMSDGIHLIVSHYEKSLVQTNSWGEPIYDPNTWMPIWTPDNNFVIENYNSSLEKVDEVKVPTDLPEGIVSRMMGVGLFSNEDVTVGAFTGDGKYNYVVTCNDMNQYWMDQYAFEVYAQGNEHVGTLCSNAGGFWNRLSSIEGTPDQWVFLQSNMETGMEELGLVETPSFAQVGAIPSEIDGKLISTNMDRFADDAEGYKYVIGLNEPATDADNNVIAQYGIYHKDFTVDSYVQLNMGPNAETFSPLVNYQSLDPHLFYADDQREFIFLAKVKGQDGLYYSTLFIGNESGEVLNIFTGDGTTKGDIQAVSILNYGTDQPELFISYYDEANSKYTNEFLTLPLGGTVDIKQFETTSSIQGFNLQGQRTLMSAPGLYIANGKKVFKQ